MCLLWDGSCSGCLAPVSLFIEGTREDAERELAARGWELVPPDQFRCMDCSRRAREVKRYDVRVGGDGESMDSRMADAATLSD